MGHSPGPWKACTASDGKCTCGVVWSIPDDIPVAIAHYKSSDEGDTPLDEMAANAALIAAAPEMLELLRDLMTPMTHGDRAGVMQNIGERAQALLARLRAAGVIQ